MIRQAAHNLVIRLAIGVGIAALVFVSPVAFVGCSIPQPPVVPSLTEVAVPTATTIPRPTQTLVPTTTSVPRPTQTLVPTATPDTVAIITAAGEPDILQSHLSPDGNWRADVLVYPCTDITGGDAEAQRVEQLILADMRNGTEAVIQSQMLLCGDALGAAGLGGLFWSPDSRIFYTTDARDGVPDGGGGICWERPLWALYPDDARIERLAGIWARSDAGDRLALLQDGGIVVRTLEGEELTRVSPYIADVEICEILWSPEGNAFVYLQSPDPFAPSMTTLTCVDMTAGTSTLLFELEAAAAVTVTWDAPETIILSGFQDGERVAWAVEQTCPPDVFAVSASSSPADVAAWDIYRLRSWME